MTQKKKKTLIDYISCKNVLVWYLAHYVLFIKPWSESISHGPSGRM